MGVEEPAGASGSSRVTPLRVAPPVEPTLAELVERGLEIAVGVASFAAHAAAVAIGGTIQAEPEPAADATEPRQPPLLPTLAGAGLGVALQAGRAGLRTASAIGTGLRPWWSFATSPRFVRERLDRARERATEYDRRWREIQVVGERAGSEFLQATIPQLADLILDQLDLTRIVLERVELDRVVAAVDIERAVAGIDLDAIVARVDLERVVDRIDLDAVAARIDVGGIVERVDLDAIVARVDLQRVVDRIDLDAVAGRIDVEAIVRRLDLAAIARDVLDQLDLGQIAREVVDEIDLPQIVRESTGTMANETVEGIRAQGMNADRAVSRLVDRLLGRDGDRDEPEGGA
jgi:hypothetical protein